MNRSLERVLERRHLEESEASDLLRELAAGDLSPAVMGALLAALRAKGENDAELRGFARAMRELARKPAIPPGKPIVDAVGTGGDGSGSLNLTTGSALLAAACGCRLVKHGNHSVSSLSGSADLLDALGLPMPLAEAEAGAWLDATGFTFLYAPYYHPAMKILAPIRKALGVRTIFNLLGPITNPAEPPYQMIGAYSAPAARLLAQAVSGLAMERAFVVHGHPGWDEPTPSGPFLMFDVRPGRVSELVVDPALYGIAQCQPDELAGGTGTQNATELREVFAGRRGAHREALILGAALVLQLTGEVIAPRDAASAAAAAIDDGRAMRLIERLPGPYHV